MSRPALVFAAIGVMILTIVASVVVVANPLVGLAVVCLLILLSIIRRPAGTAALTVTVALFFPPTIGLGLPIETVSLVMLAASALAVLGVIQRAVKSRGEVHFAGGGVLVLVALLIISSLFTASSVTSIVVATRPYLFAFVMLLFLANEARIDPAGFRRTLRLVAWLAAGVSVLALYQRATGTWPVLDELATGVQYTSRAYAGRPGGTMGHPILFGAVAALGAILAITQRGRLWIIAFALSGIGVLISGSRSAWVAITLGVLFYLFDRSRDKIFTPKRVTLGLVAAAIAAPFVLTSSAIGEFINDLGQRFQIAGDVSGDARNLRLDIAFARIFSSFETVTVGHGALSDSAYLTAYGIGDGQATTFDNMYAAIWHNFGLLLLIPLAVMLLMLLIRGNAQSRPVVVAFVALMFFVDIGNWPALIVIGVIGAAITPGKQSRRDDESGRLPGAQSTPAAARL